MAVCRNLFARRKARNPGYQQSKDGELGFDASQTRTAATQIWDVKVRLFVFYHKSCVDLAATRKTKGARLTYSYLIIGVLAAVCGLVTASLNRPARRIILSSGLLAAPAGLADVVFVPEYWHPVYVIGKWMSLEGVLFSFGNGCLIMAVVYRFHRRIPVANTGTILRRGMRLSIVMGVGFAVFLAIWRGGLGDLMIMHAVYPGFSAMFIYLWWRRAIFGNAAVLGAAGFLAIYVVETFIWYWLDSGFTDFWINDSVYLFRLPVPPFVPIEEYLWAFLYGGLWANLMLFTFLSPFPKNLVARST